MTISHHPTDPTLAAFAAGTLDEGRALVVSTHLSTCPACRTAVRAFEALRGVALKEAEPLPMAVDALQRALQAIAVEAPLQAPTQAASTTRAASDLPAPLSSYRLGPWRRIWRGLEFREVGTSKDQGTRVFMLKAAPGIRIPAHAHTGIEWTCVLQGAFQHQFGRYGAGDFDEADETVRHHPFVEDDVECICLVAMQGGIRLTGWLGRMIQPLVQI
jgi:putative transcriptional regulator